MSDKKPEEMAQEYVFNLSEIKGVKFAYSFNDACDAFIAGFDSGQAHSAKLLSEKDAEIERLEFVIAFVLFNTRSNYIDKKTRELFKKLVKDFEPTISWNQFREENTDKIKALLGEE
jgi:hypothetical protein